MVKQTGRDARLTLLARRQGGAFSLAQTAALGFARSTVYDRVARGLWERRLPGVFVVAGSDRTRRQDLWVAWLAVGEGAVITHESAALLHGAERLPPVPVTLTVPHRWHHRIPAVFVHQIDDLAPMHRTLVSGLPVSSPARCVVELGATQPSVTVGVVLDDLVNLRKVTVAQVAAVLAQVARPGKPGVERVARILDERSDGYVPPASELERSLFAALAAGGLPQPRRQVPLPARGMVRGVADAAYQDAMVVLEADGRRWHARVRAARADRERDAAVARHGWVTLRFVYEQLERHPEEVCAVVDDVRTVRLRQLGRRAS